MKNAILIPQKYDLPIVIEVENFSLTNIKSAFCKHFKIPETHIFQVAGSTSEAILVSKKKYSQLDEFNSNSTWGKVYHAVTIKYVLIKD
jgi:hypothetical protein